LESLAASYAALGNLASYDATGNFNSSITTLVADAKTFGDTIKEPIDVPPDATAGIKAVGGIAISAIQEHWVKEASEQIEAVVTKIILVLDNPNTEAKLVPAQHRAAQEVSDAAELLFKRGFYSY